jgi:hypothetical protein
VADCGGRALLRRAGNHARAKGAAMKITPVGDKLLNEREDIDWLFSTHLRHLIQWRTKTKSFILSGNEDYPSAIILMGQRDPKVTDSGLAVFQPDIDGEYQMTSPRPPLRMGGRIGTGRELRAARLRKNPIKGPGKFEGETYAAKFAYDYPDDEIGSVDELGWYGKLSGKIKGRGPFHIIVNENSDGFVSGTFYDTPSQLKRAWARIEKEYENLADENDGENYE